MNEQQEFRPHEIADLLGLPHTNRDRVRSARRWMQRMGIDRRYPVGGGWYCTRADLREQAEHIWAAQVAKEELG